jgi:TRAP-type uncharacterized transport system fused permease subunit
MPPVMGVAAFIMAEILNVPYLEIALAGLIPALAFYFALFLIVDRSARREGIRALNDAEIEAIPPLTPRLHLLLPPLVLIATLLSGQSAHFFIFYYCVLSMITPPVALASFAAAAVGKAPVMATSWSAFGLSLAAFFIPLGFVFDPAILWIGSLGSILVSGLGLICATTLWGIALGGWCWGRLPIISRLMIGAAAVIGMAAPFGSLWWFLTMGTGFAIAIFSLVVARLTASSVIEHRP